jgi:hypothetical protein
VYHTFVIWDLFYFLITGLATTHLCYLGPEIDFLITGLSYIRFSYNRKTLSNNKEQFCRDPARPFLISGFSYIRLSYNRSALYLISKISSLLTLLFQDCKQIYTRKSEYYENTIALCQTRNKSSSLSQKAKIMLFLFIHYFKTSITASVSKSIG